MSKAVAGSLPTQQKRSQEMRDRILVAGARLIEERGLTSISVADIAEEAQCSVGAFYRRFANKEAFVQSLLAATLEQGADAVRQVFSSDPDFQDAAETIAFLLIERHLRSRSVYRAAILKSFNDPDDPAIFRKQARFVLSEFKLWAGRKLGRPLSAAEDLRIDTAFQMLYGTMINAIVTRPGPRQLEEPDFQTEVVRVFSMAMADIF
ncbi:MAG: TetR/AcrR family transcriptional regulator [Qingshengfaniella sp.]